MFKRILKTIQLRWYIDASKSYMGYGKATSKIRFWMRLPIAYAKFSFLMIKDFKEYILYGGVF